MKFRMNNVYVNVAQYVFVTWNTHTPPHFSESPYKCFSSHLSQGKQRNSFLRAVTLLNQPSSHSIPLYT